MAFSWQSLDPVGLEAPFAESTAAVPPTAASLDESPYAESLENLWSEAVPTSEEAGWFEAAGSSARDTWSEVQPSLEGEQFPSGLVLGPGQGRTGVGEEHYDPNGAGLPLLSTPPSVHGQKLSRSFTVRELVTSGGRASNVARISPALVVVLQAIRDHVGKPIKVTSGYRSYARNIAVYKQRNQKPTDSQHTSGRAADISIAGMTGIAIAKAAIDAAGTDIAIGIGPRDIHVDVRGHFAVWSYLTGAAKAASIAEVIAYRQSKLRGRAPIPIPPIPIPPGPIPVPPMPVPTPSSAGRLPIDNHPLLRSHGGASPDLIMKWVNVTGPGPVDVVVHFHGYSGKQTRLRLDVDKEPISGLDLSGRSRPTLALLPRGKYTVGGKKNRFEFPALTGPGALDALIADGLARLTAVSGQQVSRGRTILTGHSGGGAPIMAILGHSDPDEVHTYDALYNPTTHLERWAKQRIAADFAQPAGIPPAMRVLYTPWGGTVDRTEAFARAMRGSVPAGTRLASYFRVERAPVAHDDVPPRFGPALLADAGASFSSVKLYREGSNEMESLAGDPASESLAWLDPTGEGESQGFDEATEGAWGEGEGTWSEGEGASGEGEGTWDEAAPGYQGYDVEAALGEALDTFAAEGLDEAGEGEEAQPGEGEALDAAEAEAEERYAVEQTEDRFEPGGAGLAEGWTETGEGPYGEELDGAGESFSDEAFSLEAEGPALEALLEAEAGVGTGLADRIKGVAELMLGPTLRRGDKSPAVAALQRALNGLGQDLGVDGSFGPNTERAVRAFQTSAGLTPDGVVGPRTKSALAAELARRGGGGLPLPGPSPAPQPSPGADRIAGIVRQTPASATCAGGPQPGARALAAQWRRLTGRDTDIYVCRSIRGKSAPSVHGDGRAVDCFAKASDPTQRAQAETYAAWLIANAVELQVAYIIWNHRQWSWPKRAQGWRPYGGVNPHIDHLHIEVSWEGARQPSALFGGGVPGLGGGSPVPVPPAPIPPTPPEPTPQIGKKLVPRDFVRTYGPYARASQAASAIPALVTLAQAAIESGWGERAGGNNAFGIKAKPSDPPDRKQLWLTTEVSASPNAYPGHVSVTRRADGKYVYKVHAWFRSYPTLKAAFDDHDRVLLLPRYANAFRVIASPFAFASEVAKAGYSTDPKNYEILLHKVMRMIQAVSGP